MYGMRRGARKLWDFHRFAGFDYFDFPDSAMKTLEYRAAFDDVYGAYRGGLWAAAASDFADIFLKGESTRKLSTLIDYSLLNALNIKDWDRCLSSPYNEYDWKKSGLRVFQGMAVGALKNPDSAHEKVRDSIEGLKGMMPFTARMFRRYWPWKTAFMLGMMFERSDERYENVSSGTTTQTSPVPEKGFGSFMRNFYEFVQSSRKGDESGKGSPSLKKLYRNAEGFVRRHPYIAGTAIAYGAMYARGWYSNRIVDHYLEKHAKNQ